MARNFLHLDLDDLYTSGYFHTDYDIGGSGHHIIIKAEDEEKFLDAFAAEFRSRQKKRLLPKAVNIFHELYGAVIR